jgi:hypothetical protein
VVKVPVNPATDPIFDDESAAGIANQWVTGLDSEHHRGDVGLGYHIPGVDLDVREHNRCVGSGDIHQDVQAAVCMFGVLDGGIPIVLLGDFQRHERSPATGHDDLRNDRFGTVLVPRREQHSCTLFGEHAGRCAAHSAGGAGDQSNFAFQPQRRTSSDVTEALVARIVVHFLVLHRHLPGRQGSP